MVLEQDPPIEITDAVRGTGAADPRPKANLLNRFLAKFIDFLVVAAIYEIPLQISFVVGMVYLAIADGLHGGSLGKRMIGLTLMLREGPRQAASYREAIIRNVPFVAAYFVYHIPLMGGLIALGIIGFESFLILGNPQGIRLGDELAGTRVFDKWSCIAASPCSVEEIADKQ